MTVKLILLLICLCFIGVGVNSTCRPYERYCLFLFAQNGNFWKICEDAEHDVEEENVLKGVKEFLYNYVIPNNTKFILHDVKPTNKWKWIKNTSDHGIPIPSKNVEVFQLSGELKNSEENESESSQFSFSCTIGCLSSLEKHEHKRFLFGVQFKNKTIEQCLEKCETTECAAWEWDYNPNNYGCWIHKTINEKNMTQNTNGTLYILDRSVKSPGNCIMNVESKDSSSSEINYVSTVVCTILLIALISITFVATVIFWRKREERKSSRIKRTVKESYERPASPKNQSSSYTSISLSHAETNLSELIPESGSIYVKGKAEAD